MMKQILNRWLATGALVVFCAGSAGAQHFTQTNLTSDTGIGGTKTDANLVNPWGMSRSSGSPWWISDNGTNLSTLYGADGTPFPAVPAVPLVVSVPGGPTGTVFNGTGDFRLNDGKPAAFLFATEGGTILAWNGGAAASVVASKSDAVYKGLARAMIDGANYLYATDFHHGEVDVLDSNFNYVSLRSSHGGNGDDRGSSKLHPFSLEQGGLKGFAPFNIQNLGGSLFVTFAKQKADKHDEEDGPGLGIVAAFTPAGRLIRVFESGWWLNAPWALAESPADFGPFSHCLLVGNFGSGQIAAYSEQTGRFLGLFEDAGGNALSIDGLWGLSFGNGGKAGSPTVLYFTAGPNGESNGLFGTLVPAASDLTQGNSN
jgi:uncharacterized protein (TIGR03118 family)